MTNYSYNVFWSQEDDAYIATSPEFDGLSAFGATPQAALAEMQIVLRMALQTYEEEHWPIPEPTPRPDYSGQFRIRLPKTLHARLAEQAEIEGVSLNTLVATYLAEASGARKAAIQMQEVVIAEMRRLLQAPIPQQSAGPEVAPSRGDVAPIPMPTAAAAKRARRRSTTPARAGSR